jgi:hypothetical protein
VTETAKATWGRISARSSAPGSCCSVVVNEGKSVQGVRSQRLVYHMQHHQHICRMLMSPPVRHPMEVHNQLRQTQGNSKQFSSPKLCLCDMHLIFPHGCFFAQFCAFVPARLPASSYSDAPLVAEPSMLTAPGCPDSSMPTLSARRGEPCEEMTRVRASTPAGRGGWAVVVSRQTCQVGSGRHGGRAASG